MSVNQVRRKFHYNKFRRLSRGDINITSGVQEAAQPYSRRPSRGGKTFASGLEEIPPIQEDLFMAEMEGDF
jgi:hypothetical protein